MPNNPVQAAGEAMPEGPSSAYVEAWALCRALGNQLSAALTEVNKHGNNVFAYVLPSGHDHTLCFGEIDRLDSFVELPVDRVERLSLQLATALDQWNAQTNTPFMAHVPPTSSGRTFYYENMHRDRELPKGSEAATRLGKILAEAGRIIRDNPQLTIDRINIDRHGVYTAQKVPGVPPLTDAEAEEMFK
ncbi:hypothetical protein EPK99_24925 [Neorhizobium lilium]|uniref:Uncharacterized protein n=1 Tax=Neorhizobium lilium TaxID=2503024 RepID=A0A3S3VDX8_9HYPH|nr:hypothetical protein [Neorhizobium lilium]RWX74430.1 hypothetical protein EPK99_24925 [Neorhizobium lilium]